MSTMWPKHYYELIERVRAIDEDAAEYMLAEAPLIGDINFVDDANVDECFMWDQTRQGHEYWQRIHMKLWHESINTNRHTA